MEDVVEELLECAEHLRSMDRGDTSTTRAMFAAAREIERLRAVIAQPQQSGPTCREFAVALGTDQAKAMGIPLTDELLNEWDERRQKGGCVMGAMTGCDCIKQVNAELAEFNTEIEVAWTVDFEGKEMPAYVEVRTGKVDSSIRGPAKRVIATYCPFCGRRYEKKRNRKQGVQHKAR